MFDKIQRAFVRMGRAGLYARMDFGENAAAATPVLTGKAMRLVREGQPYHGVVLFSKDDREEYDRSGQLRVHFAPIIKEDVGLDEITRLAKEVGIAAQHCLAQEGLNAEWNGQAEQNILVTGFCPAGV